MPTCSRSFTANAAGEPIPAELVARMRTADAFGRALEVRRQLGHANVSYHLHVDRPADLQAATEEWYDDDVARAAAARAASVCGLRASDRTTARATTPTSGAW